MEINFMNFLNSEFGAALIMLMFSNEFVFSSGKHSSIKPKNECVFMCRNRNLDSINDITGLKDVLIEKEKRYCSCALILEQCTCTNKTNHVLEEIIPRKISNLETLTLINSLIDFNAVTPKILKNLRVLTMKNTTTPALSSEVFRKLPRIQKLRIKRPNHIQWVEKYFLQNLTLDYLQIQGIDLNQTKTAEFFRNLTGGCRHPSIRKLDWSHNNFGNFTKDLLAGFVNLSVLILTDSGIVNFDVDAFINLNLGTAFLNKNRIQRLPEKTFRALVENASFVSLEGNNLTCDCEMKWLQSFVKEHKSRFKYFQAFTCGWPKGANFLKTDMCPKRRSGELPGESPIVHCTSKENKKLAGDYNSWSNSLKIFNDTAKKFTVTEDEPEFIEINLSDANEMEKTFLWYANYADLTPQFYCLKNLQPKFSIDVTPEVNYLICLATAYEEFRTAVFDCLPFKTKPKYENQPWLTKKSITPSIISIFLVFLFALTTGALILYLSVRNNPTLIRGSKRVIEVKRHDKAQVLIMPRGYDTSTVQTDNASLALISPRQPLEPSRSSLSFDTVSTVSYVSVNQPTQLEILTYRMNRLRELFQWNNNFRPPVSSLPMEITPSSNQRLPPNVDLLFEYEWYTITTTTMEN